jgi:hypothetical protein
MRRITTTPFAVRQKLASSRRIIVAVDTVATAQKDGSNTVGAPLSEALNFYTTL